MSHERMNTLLNKKQKNKTNTINANRNKIHG